MGGNVIKTFFSELKRRKVYNVAIAYLVAGWLLIEVASVMAPNLLLPDWTTRLFTMIILLGFPLALVLAWVFDITPRGIERTGAETIPASSLTEAAPAPPARVEFAPPEIDEAIASVAVLPFDSVGNDEDQAVLSDGLATEIHSTLSKLHRVRVASRRSSFRFRDGDASLEEIAAALNVRYVLSGNVVRSGEKVRIIAELDDAAEGIQIWAERFERDMQDIFAVMSEISEAVVSAFGSERLKTEISRTGADDTNDLAAWNLVQKARGYLLEGQHDAFERANTLLQRAIEMDPSYAAAHATLGTALSDRLLNGYSSARDDDIATIRKVIRRAFELAPGDPFVLKMTGMAWSAIGEPTRAIDALKAAVKIAPYDFGAWGYLGWPLTARGKSSDISELLAILDRAVSVAPEHPGVPFWLYHRSVAHCCNGDFVQSAEFARQAVEKHPSLSWAWLSYANALGQLERHDEATRAASSASEANPNMSPQHYARQIELMSDGVAYSEQRTSGLRMAGLLDN